MLWQEYDTRALFAASRHKDCPYMRSQAVLLTIPHLVRNTPEHGLHGVARGV